MEKSSQYNNEIKKDDKYLQAVNEHKNKTLAVSPNPISSKSSPQRTMAAVEISNKGMATKETVPSALVPIEVNTAMNTGTCKNDSQIAPKSSKKMNFLRTLSRKSFRRNKESSNPSLATNYAENDDPNHLQIPRMLRSSSVGYISEVFFDVHNLCMIPAQIPDNHSCERRKVTNDINISKSPYFTSSDYVLPAPSTNTHQKFADRISRSITRTTKHICKHRSLSPHRKNKISPLLEQSCMCTNVHAKELHVPPNKDNLNGQKSPENGDPVNCIDDSYRGSKLKKRHYRKKRQCDLTRNTIYNRKHENISYALFSSDDNIHSLKTLADRKRVSYTSENSSIGDVSSASTTSSCENKNDIGHNKSGLSGRSSSLGHLALSAESTPLGVITPAVAKQKNYLFGGLGSLLGATELQRYFPDRSVKMFVATWNMNGKPSPASLDDFLLPDDMEFMPDIFVIGTQESDSNMTEFEVLLQTTIGPSHVLFSSAAFGILHLTIFLRRDLVWFCSVPEDDSYGLRPGTYFKTKGAVAISFQFFGTRILLVNTHLFAHEEKLDQRIQNYKNIIHGIDLPKNLKSHKLIKSKDVTNRYDIVFWMGDLNFRLVGNREKILDLISVARTLDDFNDLLEHDQLTQTRNKGEVFTGFDEAAISFLPTFKFDVGTSRYDTSSKQRVPSFTDRILYRSTRDPINCIRYGSCPVLKTSDHKPVWGIYSFKVRPGKDDVPLAAGLFQRDIYLEALKRRRKLFHQPSSRNCQTQ